jgi:hypothetical protein
VCWSRPKAYHGHVWPLQSWLTSLTQILSQATSQQYGSAAQTSPEHVLHDEPSAAPDLQTLCAQVPPPPPPQVVPGQSCGTSLTQMLSHCVVQQ